MSKSSPNHSLLGAPPPSEGVGGRHLLPLKQVLYTIHIE